MKIEILYFDECPNHKPALDLLKQVVNEENVDASINSIDITTDEMAQKMKFLGSPSIRINGKDVAGDGEAIAIGVQGYSRKCRIYSESGTLSGLPDKETLRKAVVEAKPNG